MHASAMIVIRMHMSQIRTPGRFPKPLSFPAAADSIPVRFPEQSWNGRRG
jgi:hypothetical protein